ncbi:MAG: hypothetical protein ACR2MA_06735, partial [Egibacteraceae bacterium]
SASAPSTCHTTSTTTGSSMSNKTSSGSTPKAPGPSSESSHTQFIYTEGDADLHDYDLGFTDGERGYALNFQTTEERWNESQELWRQLQEGFALDSGGWEDKSKSKSKAEDGEKAKEDE